jgi:hypothetical protein
MIRTIAESFVSWSIFLGSFDMATKMFVMAVVS